jgi:two-component system response regulator NreC
VYHVRDCPDTPDKAAVPEARMITVLLVEEEPLVRQGLHMWLSRATDVRVVGEAHTSAEAVPLAQALHPDVVLIDLSLSPQDGITATAALRASPVKTAVVLLSLHDEASIRTQARAAGAAAFVGQQEGAKALLAAIRQARPQGSAS